MAGLPLFGSAFRRWMDSGTTGAAEQATHPAKYCMSDQSSMNMIQDGDPHAGHRSLRPRQPGIREHTDESCDLPRSNDIVQHLAESCRGRNVQHVGTDGLRITSYCSTMTNLNFQGDLEATQHAYESIEAEIDQLKEDIVRLREEADKGRSSPKTEQELANDRFLSTRSFRGQGQAVEAEPESAAARLQKLHEAKISNDSNVFQHQHKVQQPLSPLDFPALDASKQNPDVVPTVEPQHQVRKVSYADAITKGMIHANDQAFSAAMAKRAESKVSDSTSEGPISASILSLSQTCSTATTQDSREGREDEEYSVIVSPRRLETNSSTNDPIIVPQGQQSAENGKPTKQAPRFAQPTQSFSRRTGETARAVLLQVSPKFSSAASPTKSTKSHEPNLATERRATQRQLKRTSLPVDWVGDNRDKSGCNGRDVVADTGKQAGTAPQKTSSTSNPTSPSSVKDLQVVQGRNGKENAARWQAKAKESQVHSPVRQNKKKNPSTGSTNTVKQRNIANSRVDKANGDSPQGQSPGSRSIVMPDAKAAAKLQRSSTLSSENSSVQFILDHTYSTASPVLRQITNNAEGLSEKCYDNKPEVTAAPGLASASTAASPCQSGHGLISKLPIPSAHLERCDHQESPRNITESPTGNSKLESLPPVANTTTKRRTSHGHLLTPIVACLDAKGLLNKTATNNAVVESYLRSMRADAPSNTAKLEPDKTPKLANLDSEQHLGASHQVTRDLPVKKALAPHLRRAREADNASFANNGTLSLEGCGGLNNTGRSHESPTLCTPPPVETLPAFSLPQRTSSVEVSSRVSSLRATANEFRPISPASNGIDDIDVTAALSYIHADRWGRISFAQRKSVMDLRAMVNRSFPLTTETMPSRCLPLSAALNSSENLSLVQASNTNAPIQTFHPVGGDPSPNVVQIGDKLIPSLSPAKKTVHWSLRDVNGGETPIKFGRAPPPNLSPSTPALSTTSNDTSPLRTPHSVHRWHIGSTSSPIPYAWTGGDGKEIKFVGYGPHAERDPNSVVDFNFHGQTGSHSASVPNGFGEDKENAPVEARVAPKSQREWAERIGYRKVPCGNVEIMQAVEHCIPFGSQLAGYCHDCMASK